LSCFPVHAGIANPRPRSLLRRDLTEAVVGTLNTRQCRPRGIAAIVNGETVAKRASEKTNW
jgi:hypothetical protein